MVSNDCCPDFFNGQSLFRLNFTTFARTSSTEKITKVPSLPSETTPPQSSKHSNGCLRPRRSHHLTNGFPTFNILLVPTHRLLRQWLLHFPPHDLSSIRSSHQSIRDSTIKLVASLLFTLIAPCTRRG